MSLTQQALNLLAGPAFAGYSLLNGKEKFENSSAGVIAVIVIFVVLFLVLWVMSLMATYRLTDSTLQVVLCVLFGSFYLFFAWIYYGFTGHKLVKISKA